MTEVLLEFWSPAGAHAIQRRTIVSRELYNERAEMKKYKDDFSAGKIVIEGSNLHTCITNLKPGEIGTFDAIGSDTPVLYKVRLLDIIKE